MTKKLFVQAISKFVTGLVLIALLLFLPAGTICYWNGWLLIGILFIPMLAAGIVMMLRNPELLEKRLKAKESEGEQKTVIVLSGVMFFAAFVVAGAELPFWLDRYAALDSDCSSHCVSSRLSDVCGSTA